MSATDIDHPAAICYQMYSVQRSNFKTLYLNFQLISFFMNQNIIG